MIIGRNYDYDDYYEDTKLYSTGDDYLDDLLEKAFCDGYEYYQREFTQQYKNGLFNRNASGMKGLSLEQIKNGIYKDSSRIKSEGPSFLKGTPSKLSKFDTKMIKKYFPKNV